MIRNKESLPITEYQLPTDPVEKAFAYPGVRPDGSYFSDGNTIISLPEKYEDFISASDEILEENGLPTMANRIPVVSYGANGSPVLFSDKMKKFEVSADVHKELQGIPMCKATVQDTVAGWHGRPGQNGSVFAELIKNQATQGSELHVHVSFMTTEQLAIISVTEGVTYSLAEVEVLAGSDEIPIKAIAYVALESTIRVNNDLPVVVDTIAHSHTGDLPKADAKTTVEHMLIESEYTINDPRAFAVTALSLKLAEKKQRQEEIGASLSAKGVRAPYQYPAQYDEFIGRSDTTSIPRVNAKHVDIYTVPELLLKKIRPTKQIMSMKIKEIEQKDPGISKTDAEHKAADMIDPARLISKRAHDELSTRLDLQDRQNNI